MTMSMETSLEKDSGHYHGYSTPLLVDERCDNKSTSSDKVLHSISSYPSLMYGITDRRILLLLTAFLMSLNFVLFAALLWQAQVIRSSSDIQFWTPFNSRLRYSVKVFESGFGKSITPYQSPPGPETDALWSDLYVEAFTISREDAEKQPNKTVSLTADPNSGYVTSFSVMHYLHCLNMIRQLTDTIYFPEYDLDRNLSVAHAAGDARTSPAIETNAMFTRAHISHCIDNLRQALMCQPDLGPVVWQWDPRIGKVQVWAETVHTCANWDEILQFAKDNKASEIVEKNTQRDGVGRCGGLDNNCDSVLE